MKISVIANTLETIVSSNSFLIYRWIFKKTKQYFVLKTHQQSPDPARNLINT